MQSALKPESNRAKQERIRREKLAQLGKEAEQDEILKQGTTSGQSGSTGEKDRVHRQP